MKKIIVQALGLLLLIPSQAVFSQQPKLMLPVGHTHTIAVAAFSQDGQKIVTGSEDKTIKIWDTQTGKLLANLKGHTGDIKSVIFNSRGDRILSVAGLDKIARLWDAHTGQLVKEISRSSYSVNFARFSPNGDLIVLEDNTGKPALLSSATGEPVITLEGYESIKNAFFSPDGKRLLVTDGFKSRIFETGSGKIIARIDSGDPIAMTEDGSKAITSTYEKTVLVWDMKTGDTLGHISGLKSRPSKMYISPDGKKIAFYWINDWVVQLWDLESGKFISDLRSGSHSTIIHYSSDSRIIYTTGYLENTLAWETGTGKPVSFSPRSSILTMGNGPDLFALNIKEAGVRVSGETDQLLEIDRNLNYAIFSPDRSKLFGSFGYGGNAAIWDVRNGRMICELKGFTRQVVSAKVFPGMKFFTTATRDLATLWTLRDNLIYPVSSSINEGAQHLIMNGAGDLIVKIEEDEHRASVFDVTKKVSLWNANTGEQINPQLWKRGMQDISTVNPGGYIFSADGKKLFISNLDWGSYIMDAYSGKMLKEIQHERLWFATVNPNFTRFIAHIPNTDGSKSASTFRITDVETGQKINEFDLNVVSSEPVRFIANDRFIAFDLEEISVYDEKGKKPRLLFPNGDPQFTADNGKVMVTTVDHGLELWDLVKEKKQFAFKPPENVYFWKAIWSVREDQVIYSTNDGLITVIDAVTGKKTHSVNALATDLQRSGNGEFLFALYEDSVRVIRMKDFSLISKLKGHEHKVKNVFHLPGNDRVLTIAEDNTARIWDLQSGNLLYTYLIMDRNYQFATIPTGYYMSNPAATRLLHYVSPDLKLISFEQLDIKYNRPDLVLAGAGSKNSLLISSFQKAWHKRLKRLGLDSNQVKDSYSLPQAEIKNRSKISFEQKGDQLILQVNAFDSLFNLNRFNIWINENPIFGQRGLSLKKGVRQLDTTITIKLNEGRNHIEASVTNVNGAESYRMPLVVNYSATINVEPLTYFIGIGVDRFRDPRYNLQYSVKDIRDLAVKLKEKFGNNLVVDTIFNEKLSVENLRELKKKLRKGNVNDRVIVAYSGHGLLSKDFDYFLSTTNVNFEFPEQNGLPYEELESLLDSIPARKKLMFIDACHSGEVDKDDLVILENTPDSLVKGLKPVAYKKEGQVGLQNSFELMQELFVNVGKSTGATVISAAAGTQFALERNDLENGVFTYSILELMNEKEGVKISELKQIVAARVLQLTNGLQKPTFRNEPRLVDWEVW